MQKSISPKKRVLKFLQTQKFGVIATISGDNSPEAATVNIKTKNNFEIVFSTLTNSRKYANLIKNQKAAFVIGDSECDITVQLEGTVEEVKGDEEKQYGPFDFNLESVFKFKPGWLRFRNYQIDPQNDIEIKF